MSVGSFDAYHKWLGIPKSEQPPNHYRLLGIPLYEDDLQVIEAAADRQMSYLRKFQSGEHKDDALKLLNQVATARLCLLKPETKSAYDALLQSANPNSELEPDEGADSDVAPDYGIHDSQSYRASRPTWMHPLVLIAAALPGLAVIALFFIPGPQKKPPVAQNNNATSQHGETQSDQPKVGKSETNSKGSGLSKTSSTKPSNQGGTTPWPTLLDGENPESETTPLVDPIPAHGPTTDLFAKADPAVHGKGGKWRWRTPGKSITTPTGGVSHLSLPFTSASEYDLELKIQRNQGSRGFAVQFPIQGVPCVLHIDADQGKVARLENVKNSNGSTPTYPETLLARGQVQQIVCRVRAGRVVIMATDKKVLDWKGDPKSFQQTRIAELRDTNPNELTLVTFSNSFDVSDVQLRLLPGSESKTGQTSDSNLLTRLQLEQSIQSGKWTLDNTVLIGESLDTNQPATLKLGKPDSEQFDLHLNVRRLSNVGSLFVGLPIKGRQFLVDFDVGSDPAWLSGISLIDGNDASSNPSTKYGQVLPDSSTTAIVIQVRHGAVRVIADAKVLIDWHGDVSTLSLPEGITFPSDGTLLIGLRGSRMQISTAIVTPASESPRQPVNIAQGVELNPANNLVGEGSLVTTKLPTPAADAQAAAKQRIREIFKSEFALVRRADSKNYEPKIALAKTLYEKGQDTNDDAAACYVMLSEAAEFAAESGQLDLAWRVLVTLGERFDVKSLPLMERAAKAAAPFAKSVVELTQLGSMYAMLIDEAIRIDDYETATKAAANATSQVKKVTVLKDQFSEYAKRVAAIRDAYESAKAIAESHKSEISHPEVQLSQGRFYCFYKGDWDHGLPKLAESADPVWGPLAKRDLASSPQSTDLVQLGDDWWNAADSEKEFAKSRIRDHAIQAWERASQSASGLQKTTIQKKMHQAFGSSKAIQANGGENGITVADAEFNPGSFFTVEFWAITESPEGVLLSKRGRLGDRSLALVLHSGQLFVHGAGQTLRSTELVNDGKWHHIAVVKTAGQLELFIDGKSVGKDSGQVAFRSISPWKVGFDAYESVREPVASICRIRLSRETRYVINFVPERTYGKDKGTMFLY